MHADLERLMALQKLDSAIHADERKLADEPARLKNIESRIEQARQAVAKAKDATALNQTARRDIEKELAVHQGRLSKYKDQSAAVKTNQEFHAIQHEMTFAQNEIRAQEDRMLERMMEADDLARTAKAADTELASVLKAADDEKKVIAQEHAAAQAALAQLRADRTALVSTITPSVLSTFELVSKRRNGIGIAEARDGICTICHVRMRPQVFLIVRRNEEVVQCDSCQRIMYFIPPVATAPVVTSS